MKENKGITLIALVITIVVLLILAGVVLSSMRQRGIIGKAQSAKAETEIQSNEEEAKIENYEKVILEATGGNTSSGISGAEVYKFNDMDDAVIVFVKNKVYVLMDKGETYAAYYEGEWKSKDEIENYIVNTQSFEFYNGNTFDNVSKAFCFSEIIAFSSDGTIIGSSMEDMDNVSKISGYDLSGIDFDSIGEGN